MDPKRVGYAAAAHPTYTGGGRIYTLTGQATPCRDLARKNSTTQYITRREAPLKNLGRMGRCPIPPPPPPTNYIAHKKGGGSAAPILTRYT